MNWLMGPWRDLTIGCGLWSLPLMALTFWGSSQSATGVAFAFYFLAMFCNNPHYMATIVRAYGVQEEFNQYRFFTIYITAILLVTLAILHWKPLLLPWVFTLYIFWSPWHYTGQNFGIALMMAKRNQAVISRFNRNLLYIAFISSFLFWIVTLNIGPSMDAKLLSLNIHPSLAVPTQMGLVWLFISTAVTAVYRIYKDSQNKKSVLLISVLLATQFFWFVMPSALAFIVSSLSVTSNYYNAGVLAFMHCAQYLWVTSYYSKKEHEARHTKKPWKPGAYYGTLIVGGIALFIPGPWIASWGFGFDLFESLFIFMALVNIHHFILDGAIWKLRDGRIAKLLLGNESQQNTSTASAAPGSLLTDVSRWRHSTALRSLGYGGVVLIVLIGAIDQRHYFLTSKDATLEQLQNAENLNPHDSRIFFRKAKLHVAEGTLIDAIEALTKAIQLNPRNLPAQLALGEIFMRQGNQEHALAHFEQLATLFRPMVPILNNTGALASQVGAHEKAIRYFEELLSIQPDNYPIVLSLAEARQLAGQFSLAVEGYERYLENAPSVHPQKQLFVQLKLGYALLDSGRNEEALACFEAIADQAQLQGERAVVFEALRNMAKSLRQMGREPEADDVLQAITELMKRDASSRANSQ